MLQLPPIKSLDPTSRHFVSVEEKMDAVGLCNLSFCLQYGIFITVNSAERVELGTRKIFFLPRREKKVLYFSGRHEKQNTLTGLQFFTQFFLVAFFLPFFLCFSSSLYL